MKKLSIKFISFMLVASLLICSSFSIGAIGYNVDEDITRVNTTFYGDSKTTKGFCWYTSDECNSDVQVVPTASFNGSFNNAVTFSGTGREFKGNYFHKVDIDSLQPGTEYAYRVGDASANSWSDIGKFVTDGNDNKFSFIAIADVQASNRENFAKAAKVMQSAIDTCPEAEFVINLGDYVNDCTNDEWDWFFDEFKFANMSMTSVPVAGNHDGNLKWNWFNNLFNLNSPEGSSTTTGVYYSFDYGNAHFAVLNSNDMYPMSQQQINWLKNDMNASDADWKIVLLHRSLYSAGKNINKPDTLIMRNVLIPVIDELGIDVVMAGHDHMYMRTHQVKNDAVFEDVDYITEYYKGEEIVFASNPDGTVNILPSTAGTKRYAVNDNAISPIPEAAAEAFSTRDWGGCYTTVTIDNDKFIYKAYIRDDETGEIELVDEYAIKKTMGQNTVDPNYEPLPTDFYSNIMPNITSFVTEFTKVLSKYLFVIVPALIKDAIGL